MPELNYNQLSEKSVDLLGEYAAKVRALAYEIFTAVFSEEEQKQVETDPTVGPDIIEIYVAKRNVHPCRAIVELAQMAGFIPNYSRACEL